MKANDAVQTDSRKKYPEKKAAKCKHQCAHFSWRGGLQVVASNETDECCGEQEIKQDSFRTAFDLHEPRISTLQMMKMIFNTFHRRVDGSIFFFCSAGAIVDSISIWRVGKGGWSRGDEGVEGTLVVCKVVIE